jgi:hypothetical protein
MAVGYRAIDPPAARTAAIAPRHAGGGAGLVDKNQPVRVQPVLPGPPKGALLGKLGPLLLLGPERLFFSVSPSRASVRCIRPSGCARSPGGMSAKLTGLAATPWVASSQARSSLSVASGRRTTSAAMAS